MGLEITSTEFVLLLPITVFIYYILPGKVQKYYLLLINLLFYATFGYKYLTIVVLEAVIVWIAARSIEKNGSNEKASGITLIISVALIVSILFFFKLGSTILSSIVAPLGISFYSLQAISYLIDVKRRIIPAERNIIKIVTFLSFFPTITSGPIYRYKEFSTGYSDNVCGIKPEYDRIINGIIYMLYGYFLKLVIASRVGIAVDKVFSDYADENYGGIILAIVAVMYSVQIFADFAGYSAIVIGLAQILGYIIPENFVAPYLSMSIREFWGRWHISFSSWLKDYIYIPLGGNRKGKLRKYINILITFVVSGIWHGVTGWHFLVWGALHGIYQIIGDCTAPLRHRLFPYTGVIEGSFFHRLIRRTFTFSIVTIAWIFFRTGVSDALRYLKNMCTTSGLQQFLGGEISKLGLSNGDWTIIIAASLFMIVIDTFQYKKGLRFDGQIHSQGVLAKCVAVIVVSLVILIFGVYGDQHDASYFIYRGF